jgi:uncharacterized protein HemX
MTTGTNGDRQLHRSTTRRNTMTSTTTTPRTPADRSAARDRVQAGAPHRRSERGEGVISTAIAVLIVAFLGIGLWQGFQLMMDSATQRTQQQVEQIGG